MHVLKITNHLGRLFLFLCLCIYSQQNLWAVISPTFLKNYHDEICAQYEFTFNNSLPVELIIKNNQKSPIYNLGGLIHVKNDIIFPIFNRTDFCLMPSESLTYHYDSCALCKEACLHEAGLKDVIMVEQSVVLTERDEKFLYSSPFPIKSIVNCSSEPLELVEIKTTLNPDEKKDFSDDKLFQLKMRSKAKTGKVLVFCAADGKDLPIYWGLNTKMATYLNKNPLKRYLLPETHPLQKKLAEIFNPSYLFNSRGTLQYEGFEVKKLLTNEWNIMVFKHPTIKKYLIKKFVNRRPFRLQLGNYLRRINGAVAIDNFIKKQQLKHMIVPKKWLYKLPKQFFDLQTMMDTYVLIVEEMDICSGANSLTGENARQYACMDEEMITELCILLHGIGGCDAYPQNQPMTHSQQVAFIDTEHYGMHFGDFYRVIKYLNPALQSFAEALWSQLESENQE